MDLTKVLEKTYETIEVLKTTKEYKEYQNYEQKILSDQVVIVLLQDFNQKKVKFEEAFSYGKYYPGFNDIKKDYQEAKIKLMSNELFRTYKAYEKEIDLYILEIETKIKDLLNIHDKHSKPMINIGR